MIHLSLAVRVVGRPGVCRKSGWQSQVVLVVKMRIESPSTVPSSSSCFGQSLAFVCPVPPSVKWKEEYREAVRQNPPRMNTGYFRYRKENGTPQNHFIVGSSGINTTKMITIWQSWCSILGTAEAITALWKFWRTIVEICQAKTVG